MRVEQKLNRTLIGCPVYSDWPCSDVNCNRTKVCGRIREAKRRMMAHDAKQPRARKFAWGADYDLRRHKA